MKNIVRTLFPATTTTTAKVHRILLDSFLVRSSLICSAKLRSRIPRNGGRRIKTSSMNSNNINNNNKWNAFNEHVPSFFLSFVRSLFRFFLHGLVAAYRTTNYIVFRVFGYIAEQKGLSGENCESKCQR